MPSDTTTRLRAEDFAALAMYRLATTNTALHGALVADRELRREIAGLALCAVTSPDALIVSRLEAAARAARTPENRAEFTRLLTAFRACIGAIERVSPATPTPPRAA